MGDLISILTLGAALGCGLIAGVFFAFSTFIMRALARLAPAQGIEAMQWINRTVLNAWFLGVFFGTAAISILLAAYALWRWQHPGAAYLLAGGVLYVVGTFLVTVAFNVPMNNALASVQASSNEASHLWSGYISRWTAWNHVRTLAAFLAAAAFILAHV